MSEDPPRLRDALADVPPELVRLVRSLDEPPPLPPAIRLEVRARLRSAVRPPKSPIRWIAPAVVAIAALAAGLLLWVFRAPAEVAPVELAREPELAAPATHEVALPEPEPELQAASAVPEPPPPAAAVAPRTAEATRPVVSRHRRASDAPTPPPARPVGAGALLVNTVPWSRVYVDGRLVGTTPLLRHPLPAGPHQLRLEADGYEPVRVTIAIEAGETLRVVRRFGS